MKWYIQLVQFLACENEDVVESILKDEKIEIVPISFEGIGKFASAYYQNFRNFMCLSNRIIRRIFCGKN